MTKTREHTILVIANMKKPVTEPDLIEGVCEKLRILSVETRLRMLLLLQERDLCVGALARRLELSQGAVSQHLKTLRDAGLVTAERDGYYVHYRVDGQALGQWRGALDALLERLQRERRDGAVAEDAAATGCKRRKEGACARRKTRVDAGKGAT